jgi:putative transposon-encoded protein
MGKRITREEKPVDAAPLPEERGPTTLSVVKFEVFGEEMVEKEVKPSGNSGRVYLPPDWVGSRVKVIRIG